MPICPNCKIQVAGATCPRCGTLLAPPPPGQPAQTPTSQPYTQPAAMPPTAPKKSKKGLVIAVVLVVVILIVATLAYLFVFMPSDEEEEGEVKPGAAVTAKELFDDWNLQTGRFKGLDDGDTIIIRDIINEIEHLGAGGSGYGDVNWTIITFESTGTTLEDFLSGYIDPVDILGIMIFSGNLTGDYQEGDKVDVQLKIVDYTIEGQTAELPEWYVDIMDAYAGTIDFEDIEFPDSSAISHTSE